VPLRALYKRASFTGRAGWEELLPFAGDEDHIASGSLVVAGEHRYMQATVTCQFFKDVLYMTLHNVCGKAEPRWAISLLLRSSAISVMIVYELPAQSEAGKEWMVGGGLFSINRVC
jgi:hypothetical protein